MANGLLQLIAQPQVADVVGQFQAGRQSVQNNALANLAMQQRQQQLDIGEQQIAINEQALAAPAQAEQRRITEAAEAEKLQKLSFDLVTLASINDPQKQRLLADRFIQEAQGTKLGGGAFINELQNAQPGIQTNQVILQGVMDAQLLGIIPGGDSLSQQLQRQADAAAKTAEEERKEKAAIRKEVRGSIDVQMKDLSEQAAKLEGNYRKVKNLAANIKKGNRISVAQGLVALVKLGDPTSVVSGQEMANALNNQNPVSAVANLLSDKGVSSEVVDSISTRIDPLNPLNVDTQDLLDTANSIISASVPSIQQQFEENLQRANDNLSEAGVRAVASQGRINRIRGLSELLPNKRGGGQEPQPTGGKLEFLGFE